MIGEMDIEDLKNIIYNNHDIDFILKDKIFECAELIIRKYPIAYRNLYANLETITIRHPNNDEEIELKNKGVDSAYKAQHNLMLLSAKGVNSKNYKNLILHELFHVASFDGNNIGFTSFDNKGKSLNEGMTEYLVQTISNDNNIMPIYNSDYENIKLLCNVITVEKLINSYFSEGLLGLFRDYDTKIGTDNLNELIRLMDLEHLQRGLENKYKNQYIKLFLQELSKLEFDDMKKIQIVMENISSFLEIQYNCNIPNEITNASLETIRVIGIKYLNSRKKTNE
ncbi:MAG: hypothetical protein IJY25_06410 [Bacilli bacterium]|nr:hypothetical protein [Bacilli bacterium]